MAAPATATKTAGAPDTAKAAPAATVPFVSSSYEHTEINQDSPITWTPGTTAKTFVLTVNAGGFLRGLYLTLKGATGVLGTTASLVADAPWSVIQSIEFESVQGKPLLYPLSGYEMFLASKYCRPWDGDPATDPDYSDTINPAWRIRYYPELRATLGCLPNTDSRAKFRMRVTVAPLVGGLVTVTTGVTAPNLTLTVLKDDYAQPDPTDILGRPTTQTPPGVAWQRFLSVQQVNSVAAVKWYQLDRVGNYIRSIILEVRDDTGARVDLTGTPVQWQVDNAFLVNETREKRDYEMWRFFSDQWGASAAGAETRPTGIYVYSRWHKPGDRDGMTWLATSTATLLQFSLSGAPAGGVVNMLVEDLAPTGVGDQGHQFGL